MKKLKDDRSLTSVITANETAISNLNENVVLKVNGVLPVDNEVTIPVGSNSYATDIPMSETDSTSIFDEINAVEALVTSNALAITKLLNDKNSVVQINNSINTAIPFPTTSTQAPYVNVPLNSSNFTVDGDTVTLNSTGIYRFDFYVCVSNLDNNTAGNVYIHILKGGIEYFIHSEPVSAVTEQRMIAVTRSTFLEEGNTFTITGYTSCTGLGLVNLNGNTNAYELTITKIVDNESTNLIKGKTNEK